MHSTSTSITAAPSAHPGLRVPYSVKSPPVSAWDSFYCDVECATLDPLRSGHDTMDAESFRRAAEEGRIVLDCHELVLRIAYVYLYGPASTSDGVFDSVKQLHKRGWSFGSGKLKFNRCELLIAAKKGHYSTSLG